jgi:hypothetical protein
LTARVNLAGEPRLVDHTRALHCSVHIDHPER